MPARIDRFDYLRLLEPSLISLAPAAQRDALRDAASAFDRMDATDQAAAVDVALAATDAVMTQLWQKAAANDISAEEVCCLRRGLMALALARHHSDRVRPFPGWDIQ